MTRQITVTWSNEDACWIARHSQHRFLSGHSDTPSNAVAELMIAVEACEEIMTNVTHTVTCLHVKNFDTNQSAYIVGYLVRDEADRVIIAQSIHQATGMPYQEMEVKKANVIQRYDVPVVWW